MSVIKDDGTEHLTTVRRWLDVDWRGSKHRVELVVITPRGHELEAEAAAAFDRMAFAADLAGFDLRARVNTAFRGREYQQRLYDKWRAYSAYQAAWTKWSDAGKQGPAPAYVAYAAMTAAPGSSEHEIGKAVDIERADSPALDAWLDEHAHEYGFKRTVASERWHYGYVGL